MKPDPKIAYFSMEIALEPAIPTYSGGLGVLAGDTVRSCADLGMRMVAVTLLPQCGEARVHIDACLPRIGELQNFCRLWRFLKFQGIRKVPDSNSEHVDSNGSLCKN